MRELKRRTPHIRGPALGPARRLPGDRSGIRVKGYKQTESTREGHLSVMSVELGQHLLSGFDPAILGFLENGANGGADHGVTHAHNVNARDALTNVGVNALEVVEDGLFPVGPFFFEEKLTVL